MFRIDDATAATSLPAPETAGTEGYFTEGNPATGTPATKVRGSWLNMIQEELCAILAAAGIVRSKTSYNQVNAALQKMYSPVVGTVRNLAMIVTAASASATLTADQIVVASALNGQTYILSSFNKPINLATTGAGGMDTGTAPVSGFVALYAIYNPTTGTSALLATNATSTVAPNVYGGANMPSGYTASALVSVVATNGSGQFMQFTQRDRDISVINRTILSQTGGPATPTAIAATAMPKNAVRARGYFSFTDSVAATVNMSIYADAAGGDQCTVGMTNNSGAFGLAGGWDVLISTQQAIYWSITATAGAPVVGINLERYSI